MLVAVYDKARNTQKLEIEGDMDDILNELVNLSLDVLEMFQEETPEPYDYLREFISVLIAYKKEIEKESEVIM